MKIKIRKKIEINIDGIKVNNEKKTMYFLLAIEPLTLIFCFKEFLVSKNINAKKINNNIISTINKYLRVSSLILKKFFSIKVKNVIKPSNNVAKKIVIKNRFLFINACIDLIYIKFKKK